jgi:hypothetical protein
MTMAVSIRLEPSVSARDRSQFLIDRVTLLTKSYGWKDGGPTLISIVRRESFPIWHDFRMDKQQR